MNAPPEHDEPTDPRSWILLVGAASLCELVASSLACGAISCSGLNAYAVSVGAVSTAFVTPIAIVYFAEPLAPPRLSEAIPHLSLLLLVWWIPAIFLLTFVAPFSGLSNGWFATVGAAAGAFNLCRAHVPALEGVVQQAVTASAHAPPERTVLLGLGVSSTAVWVGAAISATLYGDGPATHVWAIIVGVISSVLCAFCAPQRLDPQPLLVAQERRSALSNVGGSNLWQICCLTTSRSIVWASPPCCQCGGCRAPR